LLYPRIVTQYLTASSNISTDASVGGYQDQLAVSESSQVQGKFTSEVSSIISYNDLGAWTGQRGNNAIATSSYPNDGTNYVDPLYLGASKNPFVAQIETSFLIGLSKKDQEDANNPKFSRALNVFETNPVESNIEIYWESTTSGDIATLNNLITSNTGFVDAQDVNFTMTLNESDVGSSTPVNVAQIQPLDADGTPAGYGTITLTDVRDGNNFSQFSNFQLDNIGASVYNLQYIGNGIPVVSDIDVSTLDFTFTVQGIEEHTGVTVNNQSVGNVAPIAGANWQTTWNGNAVGSAGVVLNSTLFLNYSNTPNTDFFRNGCANSANYYNGVAYEFSPYTGPPPASASDQIQDVSDLITLNVFQLIPRGTVPPGLFELYHQSGPPSIGIQATSAATIASYPLTLRVTDRKGSGLSTDFDFDLVLS